MNTTFGCKNASSGGKKDVTFARIRAVCVFLCVFVFVCVFISWTLSEKKRERERKREMEGN